MTSGSPTRRRPLHLTKSTETLREKQEQESLFKKTIFLKLEFLAFKEMFFQDPVFYPNGLEIMTRKDKIELLQQKRTRANMVRSNHEHRTSSDDNFMLCPMLHQHLSKSNFTPTQGRNLLLTNKAEEKEKKQRNTTGEQDSK